MPDPIVVWRRPAQRGPTTPLVILLHGRGADEHDLVDLADAFPRHAAYASLRAPVELPEGGFTWFRDRGVGRPQPASLRSSIDGLRAWLDGPATAEFARDRTLLLGFSAGMMMAGALLLDDPARYAGAVLLAGALPLDAGLAATPQRLAGTPVFTGHGTLDDVIPPDLVRQTMTYLRERSGATLTERTYPRGHGIARREIDDVATWLAELL